MPSRYVNVKFAHVEAQRARDEARQSRIDSLREKVIRFITGRGKPDSDILTPSEATSIYSEWEWNTAQAVTLMLLDVAADIIIKELPHWDKELRKRMRVVGAIGSDVIRAIPPISLATLRKKAKRTKEA